MVGGPVALQRQAHPELTETVREVPQTQDRDRVAHVTVVLQRDVQFVFMVSSKVRVVFLQ